MNKVLSRTYSLPTVRIGPLICIPDIIRELGFNPEPIFKKLGFNVQYFADPDNEVPYIRASKLFARCIRTTGREDFGLLIAENCSPSVLGIAGYILREAPNVREALLGLQKHLVLHDRWADPVLEEHGEMAVLSYRIRLSGVHSMDHILDMSMAMACKILRSLCGPEWQATEVHLARPKPRDDSAFQQWFQVPIKYDAVLSAVVFPASWLEHKLTGADPLLLSFLEKQAAELHTRAPIDLVVELHKFIGMALATGYCTSNRAAEHFGMHVRTLNRNLNEKGTSFRREMDNARYELARKMLANGINSSTEIAILLGYSDVTGFIRAFKRWSNMTPEQWRSDYCD